MGDLVGDLVGGNVGGDVVGVSVGVSELNSDSLVGAKVGKKVEGWETQEGGLYFLSPPCVFDSNPLALPLHRSTPI